MCHTIELKKKVEKSQRNATKIATLWLLCLSRLFSEQAAMTEMAIFHSGLNWRRRDKTTADLVKTGNLQCGR